MAKTAPEFHDRRLDSRTRAAIVAELEHPGSDLAKAIGRLFTNPDFIDSIESDLEAIAQERSGQAAADEPQEPGAGDETPAGEGDPGEDQPSGDEPGEGEGSEDADAPETVTGKKLSDEDQAKLDAAGGIIDPADAGVVTTGENGAEHVGELPAAAAEKPAEAPKVEPVTKPVTPAKAPAKGPAAKPASKTPAKS